MSLVKYNAMLKVIEHNSITKAAEEIGYTQSGISYMVKTLENEFGFPLLIRSKEGVIPTENALRLKPVLQKMVDTQQELENVIQELKHASLGTIRIGSYNSMLLTWLPQILKKFYQKFPDVDVKLVEGMDPELVSMLKNGSIDIAFTANTAPEGFKFMKLASDPFQVIVPKDHPLAEKDSVTLADVARYKLVLPNENYYNWLTNYLDTHDSAGTHFSYQLKDSTAIISMVANDLAITILPKRSLSALPENVVVKDFNENYSRVLGITYPDNKQMSSIISAFLTTAKEVVNKKDL